jgi:trk system potassium uptake protein TrkA
MALFHKKEKAIIVGCGRLGSLLAGLLSDENAHVTVMDRDEAAFRKLPSSYSGLLLEGDGSDFDTLVEAGAHNATLFIAATNDDDLNVMMAQMAKEVLHVDAVVARLKESAKEAIVKDSGILVLSPAKLCLQEFCRLRHLRCG